MSRDSKSNRISKEKLRRRLATIVFADVADFSSKMSRDEVGTSISVSERIEKFRSSINSYSGEFKSSAGDSAFMIFESAVDAVTFAVEMIVNRGID